MAFKFETANERWSWHKRAENPWAAIGDKRVQYEYDSLGDLWRTGPGAQMLQAIEERFPGSTAEDDLDPLLLGIENVLYGHSRPGDEERYGEIAAFAKEWLDQNGWTVNHDTLLSGDHDEFPYQRKMPGEIYGI